MNFRLGRVAVVLAALLCSPPRSVAQTGCSAAVQDLQRQTRALHNEAQAIGGAFLIYDGLDLAVDGALGAFGKRLDDLAKSKTDPLAPPIKLLRDAQEREKTLSGWDERLNRWEQGINGYRNCLKNPGCSFLDWMRENEIINKELHDWLKSIGDGGFEKATERVERASELLKNYTAKVGNAATGAMKTALACMRADVAKAQIAADQEAVRTATARPTATPAGPPPPNLQKGGGGGAKILGGLLLAGGAAAAGIYAGKAVEEATTGTSSGSSGSSGGGGMTFVSASGLTCFFNSGGLINRCSGTITVNITSRISSGSRLRLLTQGAILSDVVTSSSSPPGTMNFPISGGTGSQSCPAPITQLNLVNTSVSSSDIVAQAGGLSLRISCQ